MHTVDLLLWLLGDIARVQARTATMLHAIETEDTAVAVLEFAIGGGDELRERKNPLGLLDKRRRDRDS